MRDIRDHAAMDAKIGKVTVAQPGQFAAGLVIEGHPARGVLHLGEDPGETGKDATVMGRVGVCVSHFVLPSFAFACDRFSL